MPTRHRSADLELHQRLEQECEEVARHEALDARRVLQEHRGDELVALQEVVATLEVRLVLVGDEELFGLHVAHVGHERPAAVGGRFVRDEVVVNAEAEAVADLLDPPVTGVLPRPPPRLLAVADLGHLLDLVADPASRPALFECLVGFEADRDGGPETRPR